MLQKISLDVQGIYDSHSKMRVNRVLNDLGLISKVDIDTESGKLNVVFDSSQVSMEQIKKRWKN